MVKKLAVVFGVLFLLVGVLGFVSNPIVGGMGMFHTNMLHNVVHLVIGLGLLMAAKNEMAAKRWMKIFGVVYLLVAVLGFLMVGSGEGMLLGLVAINGADNWLHLVLGVVLLLLGMAGKKTMSMPPSQPAQPSQPSSMPGAPMGGQQM